MRVCELTGKNANIANNVSHANNKSKKRQTPNIQSKRVFVPERDAFVRLSLSTRAIRTLNKLGLEATCRRLGVDYQALLDRKLAR